jgi:hypothetical protein
LKEQRRFLFGDCAFFQSRFDGRFRALAIEPRQIAGILIPQPAAPRNHFR